MGSISSKEGLEIEDLGVLTDIARQLIDTHDLPSELRPTSSLMEFLDAMEGFTVSDVAMHLRNGLDIGAGPEIKLLVASKVCGVSLIPTVIQALVYGYTVVLRPEEREYLSGQLSNELNAWMKSSYDVIHNPQTGKFSIPYSG